MYSYFMIVISLIIVNVLSRSEIFIKAFEQ